MRKDYSKIGRDISHAVRNAINSGNFEDIGRAVDNGVRSFTDDVNEVFGGPGSAGGCPPHPYAPNTPQDFPHGPTPGANPVPGSVPPVQPIHVSADAVPLVRQRSRAPGSISGLLMLIFGLVCAVPLTVIDAGVLAAGAAKMVQTGDLIVACAVLLSLTAAAFAVAALGGVKRRRARRWIRYQNVLDGAEFGMVKELAETTGQSEERTVKDLKKMIDSGMYPQGHLDSAHTCFMIDDATYEAYLESEKAYAEQQAAQAAEAARKADPKQVQLDAIREEGKEYLLEIRAANDEIPGEEVSNKLYQLENVSGRIFKCVEEHPEKLPDIRKFMRYYMPTVLKLVNSYAEFDKQPVQGEHITQAKTEIEQALDTVNEAFENLLDSLFEDDAFDISTDISTLETMLKQEGLTGSDFKKQP